MYGPQLLFDYLFHMETSNMRVQEIFTEHLRSKKLSLDIILKMRYVAFERRNMLDVDMKEVQFVFDFLGIPDAGRKEWVSYIWYFTRKFGTYSVQEVFSKHPKKDEITRSVEGLRLSDRSADLNVEVNGLYLTLAASPESKLRLFRESVDWINSKGTVNADLEYVDLKSFIEVRSSAVLSASNKMQAFR